MRRTFLLIAAPLALALAACEGGATGPATNAELSESEAQMAAAEWDAVAATLLASFGPVFSRAEAGPPSMAASTTTDTFRQQRACPAGGSSTLAGQRTVTRDPATHTGSMQMAATRTDSACTVPARGGQGGTLTIDGSPNIQVTAQSSWSNGVPGPHVHTQKGSFAWRRSTGASGTCGVDLVGTLTPATQTYTLTGTFCGRAVNVTRTRTP